jgi:mevalonate kinase
MISASACAKIILCGEHAVVYQQPAIALPVSALRATASATPAPALSFLLEDLDQTPFDLMSDSPIAELGRLVCKTLNIEPPAFAIRVKSAIPIASGLGSGAAISAAVARLLFMLANQPLDLRQINALVYEVEKLYHGTPSGIDNTVIVYEQPVYFVREQPIELIRVARPMRFVIADTGIQAPTRISVGDVRHLVETQPAQIQPVLEAIGTLTRQVRQALEIGDAAMLGALMNANHAHLQTLTVSSPELDGLVEAARNAGALGAKLSGGGRGGNMIALVTDDTLEPVKQAFIKASAVSVFDMTLEATDDDNAR